jgi:hypothetical protein
MPTRCIASEELPLQGRGNPYAGYKRGKCRFNSTLPSKAVKAIATDSDEI